MKDPGDVLNGHTQQDLSPDGTSADNLTRTLNPNFPIFILPSLSFPASPAQIQLPSTQYLAATLCLRDGILALVLPRVAFCWLSSYQGLDGHQGKSRTWNLLTQENPGSPEHHLCPG